MVHVDAMLVACRLAGRSALEGHYAGILAAALGNLGKLDEARAETQAGLALNPNFSVHGFRVGAESNNPIFLTQRERLLEGLRKAGVPEQ